MLRTTGFLAPGGGFESYFGADLLFQKSGPLTHQERNMHHNAGLVAYTPPPTLPQ